MNKDLAKYKGQFIKGESKKLPKPANPQIQRISFGGKISHKGGAI